MKLGYWEAKEGQGSHLPEMRVFTGKELPKGVGDGFKHWARGFRDEIEMAQQACGYLWAEKFKISKLRGCLRGEAEEFFNGLRDEWWEIEPTLSYALEQMESAFSRSFTSAQVSDFFRKKRSSEETWHSHYLYLMAVRNATGASSSLIPESLVLHTSPELRPVLESQYDKKRTDYVFHALEITQWAQTYEENERRSAKPIRVSAAANGRFTEARTCMICSTVEHIV
uniref:Retrotransposon gag domain-containing protein n=1 Tax=Hyaloperonospora arabidopsidis (strain Emoy2) TaxID=559515 RepID=M4BAA4_HYAAE